MRRIIVTLPHSRRRLVAFFRTPAMAAGFIRGAAAMWGVSVWACDWRVGSV